MATKKVSGLSSKAIQHPAKVEQQLALVSAVKAFCPKPARPLPFGDHTGRDTHNLPKLGVNTRPLINLGRRFLLLSESRRSEEHTSELQSRPHLVCRLLLEKKKKTKYHTEIN